LTTCSDLHFVSKRAVRSPCSPEAIAVAGRDVDWARKVVIKLLSHFCIVTRQLCPRCVRGTRIDQSIGLNGTIYR
jgi:hypothetical protein